jgi:hypothetical protein
MATVDIYGEIYTAISDTIKESSFSSIIYRVTFGALSENYSRDKIGVVYTMEAVESVNAFDEKNFFEDYLLRVSLINTNMKPLLEVGDHVKEGLLAYTSLNIRDITYSGSVSLYDEELEANQLSLRFNVVTENNGIERNG